MRDIFHRLVDYKPKDLNDIHTITTRRLPVPGLESTDRFIQFTAKRNKEGYWKIQGLHNVKNVTAGLETANAAYRAAVKKHDLQPLKRNDDDRLFNFDTAFLILKDLEQSFIGHLGQKPEKTMPQHHFSVAEALLPEPFAESLRELLATRTQKYGFLLPPRDLGLPAAQNKPPKLN